MKKYILTIVFVLIIAAAYLLLAAKKEESSAPAARILMTREGFSPSEVTIKKGQAIEFVSGAPADCPQSQAGCNFWPASDPHPLHDIYPEFDPQQPIGPGETWVFVFKKAGDWGFHDHFKSRNRGLIRVISR